MEKIDDDLQKLLLNEDPPKDVEIKIIQRLYKLDTNNSFHSVFHTILKNCKNTRTPSREEDPIYVFSTSNHIYEVYKKDFVETNLVVQKALARDFLPLIIALRKNLYNQNNRKETLEMIQKLFEISLEDQKELVFIICFFFIYCLLWFRFCNHPPM